MKAKETHPAETHPKFRRGGLRGLAKWCVRRYLPFWYYKREESIWRRTNPYSADPDAYAGTSRHCLGIIKEFAHYHRHYIAACRELGVSYRLVDISGSDWIEKVKASGCEAFLVWPSPGSVALKELYDERLKVMVDDMRLIVFPSYAELWMWESKRRMRDWLMAHGYPTPGTWIFYRHRDAMDFVESMQLPIVFKTNHGDCSRGVEILKSRDRARKLTRQAFSRGISLRTLSMGERQCGSVLFQEYLPDAIEWRVIKVGTSYFGYMKRKIGEYASGSHAGVYADVPRVLLDLIRTMSERHGFMSLSIDVMLEAETRPYIIEVQTIFGDTQDPRKLRVNGIAGRYVHEPQTNSYLFEAGIFDQNVCCNLRVECLLEMLDRRGTRAAVPAHSQ